MTDWMPIETAPKDGTDILLCFSAMGTDDMIIACWDDENEAFPWMTLDGPSYPASAFGHWMPLPKPPKENTNDS